MVLPLQHTLILISDKYSKQILFSLSLCLYLDKLREIKVKETTKLQCGIYWNSSVANCSYQCCWLPCTQSKPFTGTIRLAGSEGTMLPVQPYTDKFAVFLVFFKQVSHNLLQQDSQKCFFSSSCHLVQFRHYSKAILNITLHMVFQFHIQRDFSLALSNPYTSTWNPSWHNPKLLSSKVSLYKGGLDKKRKPSSTESEYGNMHYAVCFYSSQPLSKVI